LHASSRCERGDLTIFGLEGHIAWVGDTVGRWYRLCGLLQAIPIMDNPLGARSDSMFPYKSVALIACMTFLMSPMSTLAQDSTVDVASLVDGNSDFAFSLYKQIKEDKENLFFSPHSISTAMSMVQAGARGDTEKQIQQALHFNSDQGILHASYSALESQLSRALDKGGITLKVANALWPQKQYPFLESYLSLLQKYYSASITSLDYAGQPQESRKTINSWVATKTQNKISDLIPAGAIDALTRLVLVDAVYFKAAWQDQFKTARTEEADFFVSSDPGDLVKVQMMHNDVTVPYRETDNLQIAEIPYSGRDFSMLVILPKEIDGLSKIERTLSNRTLKDLRSSMKVQRVSVSIPKFKMTSGFRLKQALLALGVVNAFSEAQADFSGIDGRSNWLYISAVMHKAFIDVSEEGTEAAAATAVSMGRKSLAIGKSVEFTANHPCLFLIQEKSTGVILFMGRLKNPNA